MLREPQAMPSEFDATSRGALRDRYASGGV
jgi:hypothetical protein